MAMKTARQPVDIFLQTCRNTKSISCITQAHDVMLIVLAEIADNLNQPEAIPKHARNLWEQAAKETNYPHIQAAARVFLDSDKATRLAAFANIMSQHAGRATSGWMDLNPSRQFVELLSDASTIRCSFGFSAIPALVAAFDAQQANRTCHVRYVDINQSQNELLRLAAIAIGVDVEIVETHPFMRAEEGDLFMQSDREGFDAELCFPPFGSDFTIRETLPTTTLDMMGASERGRLQYEGIAIADALVHASKRKVVLGASAGLLFRSVGIEPQMRQEMIESGRLSSVLAVPSGMVYSNTGIASAVLTLERDVDINRPIRFVSLADRALSKQVLRGRSDMLDDVTWKGVAIKKLKGGESWARDVMIDEIRASNGILDVGRYLQSEKTQAFTAYLSTKKTQLLTDLVTLQRPRSLRKSDDSDVIIREALLSDIQETGYLAEPSRQKRILRGDLQHARRQALSKGDIVISIKGTVGSVGIVPESAPDASDDEFWTAGQSFLILKARSSYAIEVLYEYLTNDIVRSHLASLASGNTVPMLNINELRSLQVPILTEDQNQTVKQAFYMRQERFEAIDTLRNQVAEERAMYWPHNELGDDSGH